MSSVAKLIGTKGEFLRKDSEFRDWISADGSTGFKAEANRYHVYVSLACPWAHRVLIVLKLKGLENIISVTVVDWLLTDKGWNFTDKKPKCTRDMINNCEYLREVYTKAKPDFDGRVTVPTVWDKVKKTIVNNESSEIIRMLNTEFNEFCETDEQRKLDLYPETLQQKIDELNSWIYPDINNGVYRSGFARTQEAYEVAVNGLFDALEKVETILAEHRYLTGPTVTEADIRLFTTLVRFDWVYHGHFKCNKKKLIEFPHIWGYTRDIYQLRGIGDTVDEEHIKRHYYASHTFINPFGIVAVGPELNFLEPHGREKLG